MSSDNYEEQTHDDLEEWHVLDAGSNIDYDYISTSLNENQEGCDETIIFDRESVVNPEEYR